MIIMHKITNCIIYWTDKWSLLWSIPAVGSRIPQC